jgi:hypothetical protein
MEENKDIIEQTVREMKDKDWLDIHTVLVCRLISQWSAEDSY